LFLRLLADQIPHWFIQALVQGLVQLAASADEQREARKVLLSRLDREASGADAAQLADLLIRLDPTDKGKQEVRNVLLSRLASEASDAAAWRPVSVMLGLDPTDEDKRKERNELLSQLPGHIDRKGPGDRA
jgi:hypothetical protein